MAEELVGKARISGYLIHVTNEDADFDADIPTHKVEKGIDLSDHVEKKPVVVKLSGLLIRPTNERVETLINKLRSFEYKGQPVTYEGRRIYKNMLLHGLSIKASSKVMNGYNFSCTLTEVRIAQSSYVDPKVKAVTAPTKEAGRKQTENKKQSPVYHVVKNGDTYSSLGQKYGTKWQDIQKWNGYDPKKIPLGAKLRVV
ncbi:LysM peptidoglycan-binding domain-containing protein [Lysinibacillus sp. NPDC093692]|uniref:LysM peptidoglycan-binding domain-containing protein n=1 Tax=Lysinibacillus sp. NPDC093692 TaxID=3390578 RepID=UPI003CFFFD5E